MTTSIISLNSTSDLLGPLKSKRKRILLIDETNASRDLRAETMRKLGIEVDCAVDLVEARSWWRPDLYNLVLIQIGDDNGRRDRFCDDLRRATPPQRIMFLVGKPAYLSDSPGEALTVVIDPEEGAKETPQATLKIDAFRGQGPQWGVLEASRRISLVRSEAAARTRALRQKPAPVRDSEGRESRRNPDNQIFTESLNEEIQ